MNADSRPNWEQYFCQIAQVTAKRSPCERLHVGCVLVKDNRIVAQGYNGFLPGCPHVSKVVDGHEQATVHAEQNAITDCAKRGVSCEGATAYITHFPCRNCAKMLIAAGIKEINYIDDYKNDDIVAYFSKISDVSIYQVTMISDEEYKLIKQNNCNHTWTPDPARMWGEKQDYYCVKCGKYKV